MSTCRVSADRTARYHHGNLRHALTDAALHFINERGVDGFSLREAAREVGVSPSATYRHFPDKAALLAAVAEDGFTLLATRTTAAVDAALAQDDARHAAVEALHAIGRTYVDFAVTNPQHFRVMFGPYGAGATPRPRGSDAEGRTPYDLFILALDGLVHAGVIEPDHRTNAELPAWSAVHGLASLLIDGPVRLPEPEARQAETRRVVRFVLSALNARTD